MATREAATLEDLTPWLKQDGVGVGLGSEHAVSVVEVVGERLRDLEAAAAAVALIPLLRQRLVGSPVRLYWHATLTCGAARVLLFWAQAIVRLWLQGNQ